MPGDSGLQDSVEKGREAFRRSMPDVPEIAPPARRPESRGPSDLHPFFRGLLETLPEIGADWSIADRDQWLETARNIFALLYQEPTPGRTPVELRPVEQTPRYPLAEQRSA
jgi:hypothetical protein